MMIWSTICVHYLFYQSPYFFSNKAALTFNPYSFGAIIHRTSFCRNIVERIMSFCRRSLCIWNGDWILINAFTLFFLINPEERKFTEHLNCSGCITSYYHLCYENYLSSKALQRDNPRPNLEEQIRTLIRWNFAKRS